MATLSELVGIGSPAGKDSISCLPTLIGQTQEAEHDYIVVNNLFDPMGSSALIAQDGWKLIEIDRKKNHFQLYNIHDDNEERIEISSQYAEITSRLKEALYWELDSACPDL